jgi:hypothetical protein
MEAPWDVASLRREIEEKTQDWKTFSNARAMIRARVLEVRDSKSQLTPLPQWSRTLNCGRSASAYLSIS